MRNPIRTFAERLGSKDAAADADVRRASAVPGAVPTSDVGLRTRVRTAGVIDALTRSAAEAPPRLDIVVGDGTGFVRARFLGRREIPGVVTGRTIVLEGRFGAEDGIPLVLNPAYELIGA